MSTKPSERVKFASTPVNNGPLSTPNLQPPTPELEDIGFVHLQKPDRGTLNYLFKYTGEWLDYFEEVTDATSGISQDLAQDVVGTSGLTFVIQGGHLRAGSLVYDVPGFAQVLIPSSINIFYLDNITKTINQVDASLVPTDDIIQLFQVTTDGSGITEVIDLRTWANTPDPIKIHHGSSKAYIPNSGGSFIVEVGDQPVFRVDGDGSGDGTLRINDGVTDGLIAAKSEVRSSYFDLDCKAPFNAGVRLFEQGTQRWQLFLDTDGGAGDQFKIENQDGFTRLILEQDGKLALGEVSGSPLTELHIQTATGPTFTLGRTGFPALSKLENDGNNIRFGSTGGAAQIDIIHNDVVVSSFDEQGALLPFGNRYQFGSGNSHTAYLEKHEPTASTSQIRASISEVANSADHVFSFGYNDGTYVDKVTIDTLGSVLIGGGGESVPSLASLLTPGDGAWFPTSGEMAFSTGGVKRVAFKEAQILGSQGTSNFPTLASLGDLNSGFNFRTPGELEFVTNGDVKLLIDDHTHIVEGVLFVPNGTADDPSIAFEGEFNTGPFLENPGVYAISVGGTAILQLDQHITARNGAQVRTSGGTSPAPALTLGNTTTGFYPENGDSVGLAINGVDLFHFTDAQLRINSGLTLTSPDYSYIDDDQLGLTRVGPGTQALVAGGAIKVQVKDSTTNVLEINIPTTGGLIAAKSSASAYLDLDCATGSNSGFRLFESGVQQWQTFLDSDSAQQLRFENSSGVTQATLTQDGKLGLGEGVDPESTLHLRSTSGPMLTLERTGFANKVQLEADGTDIRLSNSGTGDIHLFNSGATLAAFTDTGVALPDGGVTFLAEVGTGIARTNVGHLGFLVGGSEVAAVNAGGLILNVPGTTSSPSLDLDGVGTGFSTALASTISVISNSLEVAQFAPGILQMMNDSVIHTAGGDALAPSIVLNLDSGFFATGPTGFGASAGGVQFWQVNSDQSTDLFVSTDTAYVSQISASAEDFEGTVLNLQSNAELDYDFLTCISDANGTPTTQFTVSSQGVVSCMELFSPLVHADTIDSSFYSFSSDMDSGLKTISDGIGALVANGVDTILFNTEGLIVPVGQRIAFDTASSDPGYIQKVEPVANESHLQIALSDDLGTVDRVSFGYDNAGFVSGLDIFSDGRLRVGASSLAVPALSSRQYPDNGIHWATSDQLDLVVNGVPALTARESSGVTQALVLASSNSAAPALASQTYLATGLNFQQTYVSFGADGAEVCRAANQSGNQQFQVLGNTLVNPGFCGITDTDTGIDFPGGDDLDIVAGGERVCRASNNSGDKQLLFATNTDPSRPSIAGYTDINTGIALPGGDLVQVVSEGDIIVGIGQTGMVVAGQFSATDGASSTIPVANVKSTHPNYTGDVLRINATRAATSSYDLIEARTSDGANTAFRVRADGLTSTDGAYIFPAADYAEMFEWADGNPSNEDRRGMTVVKDVGQALVRLYAPGDSDDIILGVVSATPGIIGDAGDLHWQGMYLVDDYDSPIIDEVTGAPVLNPDYDPTLPYVSRLDRQEWAPIALVGKVYVNDLEYIHPSWKNMGAKAGTSLTRYLIK